MMHPFLAKCLVIAGKAALHMLPTVSPCPIQPQDEEMEEGFEELDFLVTAAYEVMFTEEFQGLSQESQQKFYRSMRVILGLFLGEDDDDDGDDNNNDLPPDDGPDIVAMAEEFLKLARV